MKIDNRVNATSYSAISKPAAENKTDTTQKKVSPEKAFDTVQKSRKDMFILHNKNNVNVETEYKNLTTEQIDYLKNKYDVSNLSTKEHQSLMTELSDMGAISVKDQWATYEFVHLNIKLNFNDKNAGIFMENKEQIERSKSSHESSGSYNVMEKIRQKINGTEPVNHSFESEGFNILDSLKHTLSVLQLLERK